MPSLGQILFLVLWIFGLVQATAQPLQKQTKTMFSAYSVTENTTLDIVNKYGKVVINTWNQDSVVIKVDITAYERNNEEIGKLMDRVSIDIHYFGGFVTAKTDLDKNSGLFREKWNSLVDDSMTLTNRNKVNIDYELYVPEGSTVNLENKFGDVYIGGTLGSSKFNLAHGDLKAHNFTGLTRMDLSFGKANIRSIQQGFMVLRSADLVLEKVEDLDLESTSSEIHIQNSGSLKMESRNDKIIVNQVQMFRGDASFSDVKMEQLDGFISFKLNYGEIIISKIKSNFSNVDIYSESGDINLTFDQGANMQISLYGRQEQLYLSKNLLKLDRTVIDEKDKVVTLKGKIGNQNVKQSTVNVHSETGDVFVYVIDPKLNK
ncbi:DUF4097 family beta strand repeat-containing protein [Reichenbachiella ulvae]|uniref:DUF4097 family beta strand repeat-containing protein n=1 Tax=Reichenbachiella ulvae TaxID=2980104 RepID=A0ABT3CYA6_9BACT|nr:DUF4097 family beta strand repeat-containing protein [Reichenbachiella ulvae]MCV9388686.1 DUF4097 family beta strand repeat-containing protein [Reichenbachiella ulvae]